mgnify:CR=1 FL=1
MGASQVVNFVENNRGDLSESDKIRVKAVTAVKVGLERFESLSGGAGTSMASPSINSFSFPNANLSFEERQIFQIGNGLFTKVWVSSPSSTKASDGLGPLFNVRSCQRCHLKDGRGHPPESSRDLNASMVMQLSKVANSSFPTAGGFYTLPEPDPQYGMQLQDNAVSGTRAEGKFVVSYNTRSVALSGEESVELRVPSYEISLLSRGELDPKTRMSPRVAQPMIGMGLLEAIHDADIVELADPDDSDGDGISGRVSWIYDSETSERVVGRFGWKAGSPSIRDQTVSAFFTDMGLSTPEKPVNWGDCTKRQTSCRSLPHGADEEGVEVQKKFLDFVTFYAKNLAVPKRRDVSKPEILRGKKVFVEAGCAGCHTPKFVTSRNADQEAHRFQLIWPYSDLLLHDMGEDLADGMPIGNANGREWRTPPLWGIGLTKVVNGHSYFLHDGRARNLLEAILWHGGEAKQARDYVVNVAPEDRSALIKFLESL